MVKGGEVIPMGQMEHMFMSRRILQSAEYKPNDGSTATREQGVQVATERLQAITRETRDFYDRVAGDPTAANNIKIRSDAGVREGDSKYQLHPEREVAEMLTMLSDVDAFDPKKIFAVNGGAGEGTASSATMSKYAQMDLELWYTQKGIKDAGYKDLLPKVKGNRERLFEMARTELLSHTDPSRVSPENPQGFRYKYEKMMYDSSPLRFETLDAAIKTMGDKKTTVWRGDYAFSKAGMAPNNDIRQPDAKHIAEGRAEHHQLTNLFDDLVRLEGNAVGRQYICTTSDLVLLAGPTASPTCPRPAMAMSARSPARSRRAS
jgi:hypothetical protein